MNGTTAADEPQRLSKVVAAQVPCSRREAEQYIAEGRVRVDGQRVEEPQFRVGAGQRVEIDTQARLQPPVPATFLVHKPAGMNLAQAQELLGADTHWSGDASGIRRVKSHVVGLVPLMPLPTPASGLCVFTQDRRIVRKLQEDWALMEQELVADVTGSVAPNGFERMARGLLLEGRQLPAVRASWQSEARLRLAGKGIPLDLVPAMCAQVDLTLTALKRLRIGRVAMAGLPPGQWRYLPAGERF